MRWLKEFFKPSLKCERLGHNFETKRLIIRKLGREPTIIAEDFAATENCCSRCNFKCPIITWQRKDWYSSVSMPNEMWDELHDNGYLIVRYL